MRNQINGFERFINSTFGLPQQLLFRLLRVAQDPKVDLFSEEGLLDKSLIPGLGFFDKDRKDVQVEEMVQRTNKLTGLDLNEDSFGAQLGVGILTDPLTFLTGGATALGRGGAAMNKARKVGAVAGKIEDGATLSQTRKIFKEALESSATKPKERRFIEKALNHTDNPAFATRADETIDSIGKLAKDRELRVSAPFFNMAGKGIYHTQDFSNWISLISKKTGTSKVAGAIGSVLSKVPVIKQVLHQFQGVAGGFKASGLSKLSTELSGVISKDGLASFEGGVTSTRATDLNVRIQDKGTDKLFEMYEQALGRGHTPESAFVKGIMGKNVKADDVEAIAAEGLKAMGIESLDALSEGDLLKFIDNQQSAVGDLVANSAKLGIDKKVRGIEDLVGDTTGFKFGKGFRDYTRKVFNADTPLRSLVKPIQNFRSLDAISSESMKARGIALNKSVVADAEKLGMSTEDGEQFFMMLLQGDVVEGELAETRRMLGLTKDVERFAKSRDNLALRLTRLSEMVVAFSDGKEELSAMAKGYKEMYEAVGPGSKLWAFYDEGAVFRTVGDVPALGGSRVNRRIVRVGRSGEAVHAGNMSDAQLGAVTKRLNKSARRPMQKHEVMATVREDEIFTRLSKQHGLSADDLVHNLERAKKSKGLRYLTRAPKRPGLSKPTGTRGAARIKLTDEQVAHFQDVAKLTDEKFTVGDIRQLNPADRLELRDLERLQELRATGKEAKMPKAHPSIEKFDVDPRQPNSIWSEGPAAFDGDTTKFSELSEGAEAIARTRAMSDEMRRANVIPTPAFLDELEGATIRASRAFTEPIDAMLEKAGATAFRSLANKTRGDIMSEALEHGLLSAGSPLGYVGRILGRNNAKAIEELLGRREIQMELSKAMPTLSSGFSRNLDALPIEDLNEVYKVLSTAGNPHAEKVAKEIADMALDKGLKLGKYETSPQQILIARLSQGQTRYNVADATKDMLESTQAAGQTIAGRVVKVLRNAGRPVAPELERLKGKSVRGATATLHEIESVASEQRMSGLVVKQDDGVHRFIPFNAVGRAGGILPLDTRGALHEALKLGPDNAAEVDAALDAVNTHEAFSLRASRGKFSGGDILETLSDAQIGQLDGQHIVFGDTNVLGGMTNAIQTQWKHTSEMVGMFDAATFFVKRWQTVMRPGFHVTNAAGAFFQARVLGVSAKNSSAGMYDAMRFMHGDPKLAAVYDQFALHTSSADGLTGLIKRKRKFVPDLEFLRVIRRAGRDGVDSNVALADLEKFGLQPEDLIFKAGGQEHHIGDILDAMAKEGLFATFTNNGLKGSSSVSEQLFKLRSSVLEDSSRAKKSIEGIDNASEASEAFARLSVTFAQLREGVDLEHAVINAKRATVDYAQLTNFEHGLKRFVNFYTFPRRYIPVAARHFAEDPSAIARVSAFLKAGKSTGVTREENGQVVLDVDTVLNKSLGVDAKTGLGLNASRINPNLETLKYLEAFGEIMLNTADKGSRILARAPFVPGSGGVAAAGQEQLSGQTGQPFSFGSIPTTAFEAVTGGDPMQEVVDAFWVSRILFQPEDPLAEKTRMTELLGSVMTGAKFSRPEHEAKLVEFQYKKLIGDLNKKAQKSKDPEFIQSLRDEAQRLQTIARERLDNRRGI